MKKVQSPKKNGPKKNGLIDTAYNKIKAMMYNQELAPGQRLSNPDLVRRLKISSTPILQALNRLENAKLVRYEQNKGFFVAEITETEITELFQVREALETYLIPALVEKSTEEDLARIRETFRAQKYSAKRIYLRSHLIADAAFHVAIAKFSGNQTLVEVLETIMERLLLKYRAEYLEEDSVERVLKEHRELLRALLEKDTQRALQVMRDHIRAGLAHMLGNLQKRRKESLYWETGYEDMLSLE